MRSHRQGRGCGAGGVTWSPWSCSSDLKQITADGSDAGGHSRPLGRKAGRCCCRVRGVPGQLSRCGSENGARSDRHPAASQAGALQLRRHLQHGLVLVPTLKRGQQLKSPHRPSTERSLQAWGAMGSGIFSLNSHSGDRHSLLERPRSQSPHSLHRRDSEVSRGEASSARLAPSCPGW